MDSLKGGSRPSRLPPFFSRGRERIGIGVKRWPRRCGHALVADAVVCVGAVALACGPAFGASYRVHDGASLQAAVARADASGSPSRIELTAGVFLPTSTLSIDSNITIAGPSSAPGAELAGSAAETAPARALNVEANGKLTLVDVQLTASGGASTPAIDDSGALDLESSTVAGNEGTGVLVQPGATATVRDSTLSGGLAFGVVDNGAASFFSSTIAANMDGGIANKGTLELTNTIVAKNTGAGDCKGRASTSDHSLDSDGSCGVGALSATDPALGTLTENGGPTSTQALGTGSRAINAGDGTKCPADDQRHFIRPPGRCDIGAYQTDATPSGGSSTGGGRGSGPPLNDTGLALVGVTGHGTLHGPRRSRIAFSVRAEAGHSASTFRYADRARHLELTNLRLRSLAIDARRGIATLHGSGVELRGRRRVSITLVLVTDGSHRSLRIQLSTGYYERGRLLTGAIMFTRRAVR